ncbi:MAG: DNA polymerase III subunit delta' [Candidatus Nealsonbacteria bacterium RBG_13_36_15]|uniref:DNA polymerase III subunit delta n=1 Tax=Candidatus Nealsonbacteria bacterium RBG_13_36_15 TaxID=1801660 RepID=A0A1G2DV09_9BACT|nr:MAG: DNA polymerase III subunit delta' [Candidatus Nealsonbacteria bacterium RBG_13_36_15]
MVIGHQTQWQFLKKSAETHRISHAYLFFGQSHLGKRIVAKEFVKLLNCSKKENHSFCNICWTCRAIQKEIHPDLIIIKPEGKEIKISQIRQLQRFFSFKPHSSLFKVVILEEAEKMNSEAQSCLLKTLEEPPSNSLLFLLTEHPRMLLPTILSRVQTIKFFPVPKSEIEDYLKANKISLSDINLISSHSFGKPGLALEFSKNPGKLERAHQIIEEAAKISQIELPYRFQYVKALISQEQDLKEILESWLRYFRNALRLKIGLSSELIISSSFISSFPIFKLKRIINSIEKINFLISTTNINKKLALEQIMMEL